MSRLKLKPGPSKSARGLPRRVSDGDLGFGDFAEHGVIRVRVKPWLVRKRVVAYLVSRVGDGPQRAPVFGAGRRLAPR